MFDPIQFRPIFANLEKNIEKMTTKKMMNAMEEKLFFQPTNREVITDFVDSKGDRFLKEVEDGIEKTIIHKKDGTHYCGTMRNGKVAELSERKPNSDITYILTNLPDGGYKETTGNYKDIFVSTYDKDGKLVKLSEEKFNVNKPFNEINTKVVLDNNGNLTNMDTKLSLIDSTREVLGKVQSADKETQKQAIPIIEEIMTNLSKLIKK